MPQRRPQPLLRLNTADLRAHISDTVNRVAYGRERVLLTRRGRPLVALVSLADLEFLERARASGRSKRG
jgi:prevent-host-death family protein